MVFRHVIVVFESCHLHWKTATAGASRRAESSVSVSGDGNSGIDDNDEGSGKENSYPHWNSASSCAQAAERCGNSHVPLRDGKSEAGR